MGFGESERGMAAGEGAHVSLQVPALDSLTPLKNSLHKEEIEMLKSVNDTEGVTTALQGWT